MSTNVNACQVCACSLVFRWSDTHGVAVCANCGMPYRIYFFDEQNKRIPDRKPEIALTPRGLEIARKYWQEKSARVFPAEYDMGWLHRRETTYSGATREEAEAFHAWYVAKGYDKETSQEKASKP